MHDERGLHAHRRAIAAVDAFDLARGEAVGDVAEARAAIGFGDRDAEQAHLAHLAHDLGVEVFLAVGLEHARHQLRLRVGRGRLADQALFLGQLIGEKKRVFPIEAAGVEVGFVLMRGCGFGQGLLPIAEWGQLYCFRACGTKVEMLRLQCMDDALDALIIGGGPAGIAAAIYLARFQRSFIIIDAGAGRALRIPITHNQPAFANGISGSDLLHRMKQHAGRYGIDIRAGSVTSLSQADGDFGSRVRSATPRRRPRSLPPAWLMCSPRCSTTTAPSRADRCGTVRSATPMRCAAAPTGVLGEGEHAVREALFLRPYSDKITVVAPRPLRPATSRRAAATQYFSHRQAALFDSGG